MESLRMLAPAAALVFASCAAEPDSAEVRLAALTASSAVDALDDIQAVDDPDAAGVRDRFRDATREALEAASRAHATAPAATADAYARSLEAAEAAQRFGDAMALALKVLAEYEAAQVTEAEALTAQRTVARIEAAREFYWTKAEERDEAATGDWRRASAAARDAASGILEAYRNAPPSVRILYEDDKGGSPEHAVAETDERVREAAGLRDLLLEDLAPKIEAAEAAVDEATAAYRDARDAWRALAAGEAGQPP